jgi:hypothetical protein
MRTKLVIASFLGALSIGAANAGPCNTKDAGSARRPAILARRRGRLGKSAGASTDRHDEQG